MVAEQGAPASRRERWAWYLYDFGNSAYASAVYLAVYSVYFKDRVVGGAEGTRLWGVAETIAAIVVLLSGPFLGTLADFAGSKKRFLLFFTAMSCLFTASLFLIKPGMVVTGIALFVLADIGYRAAQIFYDGLLPEIASPKEMGRVSGVGWAIGTVGGIVILLLLMPLEGILGSIMTPEKVTANALVSRTAMIVTAVFFVLFAIPVFVWLREKATRHKLPAGENYLGLAVRRLQSTFRTARGFKEFLKFILAFFVYNDGIMIVMGFASIIGATLFGLQTQQILVFFIIVQLANVLGSYVFGVLADRIGVKLSLISSLVLMVAVIIWLFFAHGQVTEFFVIGAVAGLAMAGAQSVSRTMVALFAPPGKSAEFFGFFATFGRVSSVIAPLLFGLLAAEAAIWYEARGVEVAFAEQDGLRLAILLIAAFIAVGTLLLLLVDEKKAIAAAQQEPEAL
ncbi:MAG TPA: MFS transporter [Anaerolineae bacterium]|nr:MFS transporter [Anaerolineae bacterium]